MRGGAGEKRKKGLDDNWGRGGEGVKLEEVDGGLSGKKEGEGRKGKM